MNKTTSRIIMAVLAVVIVYLAYLTVMGIKGPIEFDKESKIRYTAVEKKLDLIRNLQFAHKDVTGKYAATWDSLFYVIETDSMTLDRKILIPKEKYDQERFGKNPKVADDTSKYEVTFHSRVALKDTLFKDTPFSRESIMEIPYSDGQKFYMNAGFIEAGGGRIKVPVYIVTAPNKYILNGLNKKYFDPDAGYQLGSMYETTTEFSYKRDPIEYQ